MCAVLAKNPNKLYSLNYFQEMFSAAKSSISEDAAVIKQAFEDVGIGRIETVAGAHGGIRYIPSMPQAARVLLLKELTEKNVTGVQIEGVCEVMPGIQERFPVIKEKSIFNQREIAGLISCNLACIMIRFFCQQGAKDM